MKAAATGSDICKAHEDGKVCGAPDCDKTDLFRGYCGAHLDAYVLSKRTKTGTKRLHPEPEENASGSIDTCQEETGA